MVPSLAPRRILLCSVAPFKMPRLDRPYAPVPTGGMTPFEVKPYTLEDRNNKEPPRIIEIRDSFQAQRDVWQGVGYPGQHTTPQFVPAEKIVADIYAHWATGRIGAPAESGPGIFISVGDGPSANEIAAAFHRQDLYMTYLYEKALEYFNNKMLAEISYDHRISANWLSKDEIWSKTGVELAKDRCPFCQAIVPAAAYVCQTCTRVIRAIPADLASLGANLGSGEAPNDDVTEELVGTSANKPTAGRRAR